MRYFTKSQKAKAKLYNKKRRVFTINPSTKVLKSKKKNLAPLED